MFQTQVAPIAPTEVSNIPGMAELMFKFPRLEKGMSFYQRTRWKFFAKSNINYVFEISRLDRFQKAAQGSYGTHASEEMKIPTETEWEACVYDERWAEIFGQNTALSIGEAAGWDASIATFFPPKRRGYQGAETAFGEFANLVTKVCHGLSETKPW